MTTSTAGQASSGTRLVSLLSDDPGLTQHYADRCIDRAGMLRTIKVDWFRGLL